MPEKPWKRAEREVAKRLGGVRVKRHGEPAPDVVSEWCVAEVKTRRHLPKWIISALFGVVRQAPNYKLPILILKDLTTHDVLWVIRERDGLDSFGPVAAKREK